MSTPIHPRLALATLAVALAATTVPAQSAAASQPTSFHEAYYLHHARGDLKGALALYREAAADTSVPAALRSEASRLARGVAEELASSDFARLVPPETILYVELNRPGAQLGRLIDQLGLTAEGVDLGISPKLIDGLLGVRGIAIAVTEIDPRGGPPNGVAIVHPGDLDVLRGLVETALPFGGERVEAIGGHPTFRIEGQVFVTTTERLVLVSPDPKQIAGVVARLEGKGERRALVDDPHLATAMAMRGDDLMFFCMNLAPVMPMLSELVQREARHDPEARAALAFLDLESTRYVAGRAGVGEDGMSFDFAVELDEGHRNLAFNLMRMPPLGGDALDMVPSGAAFFCAAAINHKGAIPAGATDGEGAPVVTALDFGREVFANVADVALFAMPTVSRMPMGPIPDAALALRVNDPARSRALWRFVLGTAQSATGGPAAATTSTNGEVSIDRYEIQGVPVFVGVDGQHLVVSPSEGAVTTAMKARRGGATLRQDAVFQNALTAFGADCTQAMALNVGRCGELASHYMSDREKREAMPVLQMMKDTSLWFRVDQSARRLAVAGRVTGIPDVGPLVEQLVQQELRRGRGRAVGVSSAPGTRAVTRSVTLAAPASAPVTAAGSAAQSLEDTTRELHAGGRRDAARAAIQRLQQEAAGDAFRLNNFAWALLTDEAFGNAYDDLAIGMSHASNEASGWSNWYYLDTYAHALMRHGRVDEAIAMERKAIAAGGDDPRIGEAKAALERFLAARGR